MVPRGIDGVDMFFVLSGFLITSLLLLVVFTSVVLLSSPTRRDVLVPGVVDVAVLTCTFNWLDELGHLPQWQVDHLWSLSVEEQLYIVWPLLLLLLVPRIGRRRALALVAGAALLSSVTQGVVLDLTGSSAWGPQVERPARAGHPDRLSAGERGSGRAPVLLDVLPR